MAQGKPVSGRKVRAAVGDTIATVNVHAQAMQVMDRAIGTIGARVEALEGRMPPDGWWRRLLWLLRGPQ